MEKNRRRREKRHARTDEIRKARFITDYLRAKYNHIYNEATQFYNNVIERNPGKKDPRKTIDFLRTTTEYTSYNQYYSRPKQLSSQQKNTDTTPRQTSNTDTTPRQTSNTVEAVLNIPLIPAREIQSSSDEGISDNEDIQHSDGTNDDTSNSVQETQQQQPPVIVDQELVISDSVYQDILQTLRQDPDLNMIFNDMDILENEEIRYDHDDDRSNDLWDSFNISEPTPLERELQGFK